MRDATRKELATISARYLAAVEALRDLDAAICRLPRNLDVASSLRARLQPHVRRAVETLDEYEPRMWGPMVCHWTGKGPRVEERNGARHEDGGTSYTAWFVAPAEAYPEDEDAVRASGFDPCRYYSHPGGHFHHVPHVRRRGSRVLVTQWGGLDV